MADYSTRFHEKFILKISKIFVKLKKQNVVSAHGFSWFAKKVVCTTYDVLGILALNSGAIFVDKRMIKFYEIKETKCRMCTCIFLVRQESRMYHIRRSWVFRLSCKMTKMYIRLYCTDPAECFTN